jgi:hypothetical protein
VLQLLVTANAVPSSPTLVSLMMETIRSSETSVPTRATRRNIPEDDVLNILFFSVTCFETIGSVRRADELMGKQKSSANLQQVEKFMILTLLCGTER